MDTNLRPGIDVLATAGHSVEALLSKWGWDPEIPDRDQGGVGGRILASPGWPLMPVGPVIDETDLGLPDSPSNLLEKGLVNNVSVLSDFTSNEGSFFVLVLAKNHPTK